MQDDILYTRSGDRGNKPITQELIDHLSNVIEACIQPGNHEETGYMLSTIYDFKQLALFIVKKADKIDFTNEARGNTYSCQLYLNKVNYTLGITINKNFNKDHKVSIQLQADDEKAGGYECFYYSYPNTYRNTSGFDFRNYYPFRR